VATLKIHVGASVDRNLAVAFLPLVEAAERARKQIEQSGRAAGQSLGRNTKKGGSDAEKEYAKLTRAAAQWQREAVRSAEQAGKAQTRAAERATRERMRENERLLRDVERNERAMVVAAERGATARARAEERSMRQATRESRREDARLARAGLSAGRAAVRVGMGLAGAVTRGMGVELDPGALVKANTELETKAVNLSNQGFMEGDARNGRRVDPAELMAQAFTVSKKTGTNANEAMSGLDKFVTKTGDLATGRDILERMAVLSKATGASLEDMTDAAGDVANAFGDIPNKGAAIDSMMKSFAGQGKIGRAHV